MTNFWDDLILGQNRMGKKYKTSPYKKNDMNNDKNLSDEYPSTDPYILSTNIQRTINKIKDYNLFETLNSKTRNKKHKSYTSKRKMKGF